MNIKELIQELTGQGIHDKAVLNVIANTPREQYVLPGEESFAYENLALPIACGQTISQPYIVALMTQAIHLPFVQKVLEIGTGSGYQTAILSKLFQNIYTIERIFYLYESAKKKFNQLKFIHCVYGDGYLGYEVAAPYDGILVTAYAEEIPSHLLNQLNDPGVMVIPLGIPDNQILYQVIKQKGEIKKIPLESVRFVPLLTGIRS